MPESSYSEKNMVADADPRSGKSLLPMLIAGLVLIVVGMIAVAVLS